jgi:hypothetical protein
MNILFLHFNFLFYVVTLILLYQTLVPLKNIISNVHVRISHNSMTISIHNSEF